MRFSLILILFALLGSCTREAEDTPASPGGWYVCEEYTRNKVYTYDSTNRFRYEAVDSTYTVEVVVVSEKPWVVTCFNNTYTLNSAGDCYRFTRSPGGTSYDTTRISDGTLYHKTGAILGGSQYSTLITGKRR